MNRSRAREVLYDSEIVLRLVDHELDELRDPETGAPAVSEAARVGGAADPATRPIDATSGARRPAC